MRNSFLFKLHVVERWSDCIFCPHIEQQLTTETGNSWHSGIVSIWDQQRVTSTAVRRVFKPERRFYHLNDTGISRVANRTVQVKMVIIPSNFAGSISDLVPWESACPTVYRHQCTSWPYSKIRVVPRAWSRQVIIIKIVFYVRVWGSIRQRLVVFRVLNAVNRDG